MRRLSLSAVGLALICPALTLADSTPAGEIKPAVAVRVVPAPVGRYGEAKPASFGTTRPDDAAETGSFGDRLRARMYVHECSPDGCPKPIGCGNFYTEKKFLFGSCRQFFGTSDSAVGHHRRTSVP